MRITFLVDGFNLYHSVVDASSDLKLEGKGTKWLNIYKLCESYLHLFGKEARLEKIFYFSALATHMQSESPQKVKKHNDYIKCLESTGLEKIMGSFKRKTNKYALNKNLSLSVTRHEEKETDVAISIKIVELFISNMCDFIVLMTGDTDIIPAIKTAKRLFPQKDICCAFPYKRTSTELQDLLPKSFTISKEQYKRFQFQDNVKLPDGTIIEKPSDW